MSGGLTPRSPRTPLARLTWVLAQCLRIFTVGFLLLTVFNAVAATLDYKSAVGARQLLDASNRCDSSLEPFTSDNIPVVDLAPLHFDVASQTLTSQFRLIISKNDFGRLEIPSSGSADSDRYFQIVPDTGLAANTTGIESIDARDFYQRNDKFVSTPITIQSTLSGDSSQFPVDKYLLDSGLSLYFRIESQDQTSVGRDDTILPRAFMLRVDCSGFAQSGLLIDFRIDPPETGDRTSVHIAIARSGNSRFAIFASVFVSIVIGLFAYNTSKSRLTDGHAALVSVVSALALIQIRPIIVPGLSGVWTIADSILYLMILGSCSVLVVPKAGARTTDLGSIP